MPTQVRFRRGTTAQNNNFTGASGEITINTSNNTIRVHDGSTLGGTELATVTHVTNSIANVIDSAPALLDTLNELAAAIGDDPGFYSNIAASTGVSFARANAAYDRANVGITYAGAAFDKANTLVATVAGVTSTNISNTNLLDGIKAVDGSSSGLDADLLDGQDGSYYLDWTNTTNKPDPVITVTLSGDVTGTASATLADVTSNTITISTTIASNSVELGTDTTGAYVANLVAGTGVSLVGLANEGATPTIAIGQAVNTNSDVTFANVTVTGNLLVQGNTVEFTANTLVIQDPLIQVGKNPVGDAVDLGFFGHYIGGSPSIERHAGLFRDATDGQFKLFTNLDPEPATIIDTANATYESANLVVNFVVGKVTDISNHSTSGLSEGSNLYFTNARSRASLTGGTGISYDTGSGSIELATSGVSAATYGGAGTQIPTVVVDTYGRITSAANVAINTIKLSAFAATSSAELAGVINDETGSGNLVFSTSPELVTPNIGTPSYAVLTNATGTASGLTANISNFINVTDDTSTNATRYPIFANGTSGAVTEQVSSTKLTFNPSSGLLTSTDYNSSSDKRLKKDIKTIEGALDKVNQLRGVTFTWKENKGQAVGLIAQEVAKVMPEVVTSDESGYMGVKYNNLIGLLVEAIKEQQEQIKDLKKQIEKLNG